MNREIKFRAWDKKLNVMIAFGFHVIGEVTMFSLIEQHIYENNRYADMLERIGDIEIMQYTGLKDKNRKEIYEGDILKCAEYDSSDVGKGIIQWFNNAVVGFSHGSFHYYPKGNMQQPHQLLKFAYLPEIIGNIYENPELLK